MLLSDELLAQMNALVVMDSALCIQGARSEMVSAYLSKSKSGGWSVHFEDIAGELSGQVHWDANREPVEGGGRGSTGVVSFSVTSWGLPATVRYSDSLLGEGMSPQAWFLKVIARNGSVVSGVKPDSAQAVGTVFGLLGSVAPSDSKESLELARKIDFAAFRQAVFLELAADRGSEAQHAGLYPLVRPAGWLTLEAAHRTASSVFVVLELAQSLQGGVAQALELLADPDASLLPWVSPEMVEQLPQAAAKMQEAPDAPQVYPLEALFRSLCPTENRQRLEVNLALRAHGKGPHADLKSEPHWLF